MIKDLNFNRECKNFKTFALPFYEWNCVLKPKPSEKPRVGFSVPYTKTPRILLSGSQTVPLPFITKAKAEHQQTSLKHPWQDGESRLSVRQPFKPKRNALEKKNFSLSDGLSDPHFIIIKEKKMFKQIIPIANSIIKRFNALTPA